MVGARVEVVAYPGRDGFRVAPGNDRVDVAIAAFAVELVEVVAHLCQWRDLFVGVTDQKFVAPTDFKQETAAAVSPQLAHGLGNLGGVVAPDG